MKPPIKTGIKTTIRSFGMGDLPQMPNVLQNIEMRHKIAWRPSGSQTSRAGKWTIYFSDCPI